MKSYKKFIIGSIIVVLGFILIYFGKGLYNSNKMITNTHKNSNNIEVSSNDNSNSKNKVEYVNKSISMKENYPQKSQKLEFSDKKNFFTIPGQENIKQDDFGEYVEGEILVDVDLDKFDEKTFEKYGAKIVGKCDTWGGYQINIPNKSIDELEKIAEKIKKEKGVVVSRVHRIIPIKLNDYIYPNDNFKYKKNNFNKENLWQDYDLENGFGNLNENKLKINTNKDPYWSYKATNLAFMWKNLQMKEKVNVGVFEYGNITDQKKENVENLAIKDLDYENLDFENIEDRDKKHQAEELYKNANNGDQQNRYINHTYKVSATIAAKHNDIGFSGVCPNAKVYPMVYSFDLLPYLMEYRMDKSNGDIKIFNISQGYTITDLYCMNVDDDIKNKDKKNIWLHFYLKIVDKNKEKNFVEYIDKNFSDIKATKTSLNYALKAMKNNGKDFLIVQCAGNEKKEIRKLERKSNVKINKTTIFDDLDKDIKNRVIIVGASYPEFDNNKTFFADFSTTKNVDIVAPGYKVPGYNKYGEFVLWEGTSVAAPFVSGLAANLYSAYPDKMNGELAKKLIIESGNLEVVDKSNGENSKLVDAKKLTELAKKKFEDKKETTKKDTKKDNNEKIIKENKKDDNKTKEGNLKKIENQNSTVSSNENQKKPPVENDDENTASKNSYKIIQDGKDQGEISILDMGDVHFIDVDKLDEIYSSDSPYFTDPQYSNIANKYKKILSQNHGSYIRENPDGSYYFSLFLGNIDGLENKPNYSYQYFPEYGVFTFAKNDYMKEKEVTFLTSKYAGIIFNNKLYVEADWLAWWFGFDLDYTIDSKNKILKYSREGHDIGQEGVDYINISTENYGDIYELLDDNFEKIN